ncbi:hypothetical protein [Streptomyces sp. NPDC059651]|uniref:hypothetical protein n=1 Tax=unclassified Streptomyces TaxID=2593676 RepID=UPI0036B91055
MTYVARTPAQHRSSRTVRQDRVRELPEPLALLTGRPGPIEPGHGRPGRVTS